MKDKNKINGNMFINDIIEEYPEVIDVLINDYGLHCIGCMFAHQETLAGGASKHGYDDKEIKEMIKHLNSII